MAILNVKLPDKQKKTLESISEDLQYPSKSEYVREALREKIEKDLRLSEKVQDRIDEARNSGERIDLEEAKEKVSG